jgi:monofunctional glycosyltransferase
MARRRAPHRRGLARAALAAAVTSGLVALAFGALWVSLPDPSPLARAAPATTALIEQRRGEARARKSVLRPQRSWVPLERIPGPVVAAVLASEDDRFFEHEGIDWSATRDAAQHDLSRGRMARGGSTITQQLAKNLWLGTERSLWRKAKEAVLAWKLERALPKRRILALYLNVVELDDGVFGIEAGARDRFGVGAEDLTTAQGVVLAALLPAPRRVDLRHPSTWMMRRSRRLLDRLVQAGRIDAEEHRHAAAELDRMLAGPRPEQDQEEPPEEAEAAGHEG